MENLLAAELNNDTHLNNSEEAVPTGTVASRAAMFLPPKPLIAQKPVAPAPTVVAPKPNLFIGEDFDATAPVVPPGGIAMVVGVNDGEAEAPAAGIKLPGMITNIAMQNGEGPVVPEVETAATEVAAVVAEIEDEITGDIAVEGAAIVVED